MRIAAIWIFGLMGSAIVGAMIGSAMEGGYSGDKGFAGFFAGMFIFACARLWLGSPQKNSN